MHGEPLHQALGLERFVSSLQFAFSPLKAQLHLFSLHLWRREFLLRDERFLALM